MHKLWEPKLLLFLMKKPNVNKPLGANPAFYVAVFRDRGVPPPLDVGAFSLVP
jgi:hypothetical protein